MSGTSFVRRMIEVTFQKGPKQGVFARSGTNTVTLSGMRATCHVAVAGPPSQGVLDLRLFGMSMSDMNDLTATNGLPFVVEQHNIVTVSAGSEGSGMSTVYQGSLSGARPNFKVSPEVSFDVHGVAGLEAALRSIPPSSYRGATDVAVVMANLAPLMNLSFVNNGVSGVMLSNPYFAGTALSQAEAAATHAGIGWDHSVDGKLTIWPKGGNKGGAIPLITPTSGLVGYPDKTPIGVNFVTLYNPSIQFGGLVKIDGSIVKGANGTWQVVSVDHHLETEVADGSWFSEVETKTPGFLA